MKLWSTLGNLNHLINCGKINVSIDDGLKREEGGVTPDDAEWTFSVEAYNITET